MVVLTEEFHGLTLKRKGAEEPELFDAGGDERSGFLPSCRAIKMRRLVCPDGRAHQDAAAGGGVTTTAAAGLHDVPMGDVPVPAPTHAADGKEDKAMMVYEVAANLPRLRPWPALRAGADDLVVRAMLREADSRTVRELLSGAQEQRGDLALAVVPWVARPAPVETEPSTPAEDGIGGSEDGAAAMDVEEDEGHGHHSAVQTCGSGTVAGWGEGYAFRWPQHCMAPPQLPAVAQASPVMWSW